jgi:dGTPase
MTEQPNNTATNQLQHGSEVKDAIRRSLAAGNRTYEEVLIALAAPDPRLLKELYEQVINEPEFRNIVSDREKLRASGTRARRLTATLPLRLPAADPIRCQWWFTLDSVVSLARLAWELHGSGPVAFLGAPTIGYFYANWVSEPISILDVDKDVLDAIDLPPSAKKATYDVNQELPHEYKQRHSVVVMDPPWYPPITKLFIARGRELLGEKGFLLCVIPSRLTRPGVIEERTKLFGELLQSKFEIVSVESGRIHYLVPEFEARAYDDVVGFSGRRWRCGDLLILRANHETLVTAANDDAEQILTFASNPQKVRFFLAPQRVKPDLDPWIKPIPEFQQAVSARQTPLNDITVWSTNKRAALSRDSDLCRLILDTWAKGMTRDESVAHVRTQGIAMDANAVDELNDALALWSDPDAPQRRRSTAQLTEYRKNVLCELAAEPSARLFPYEEDGFRLGFQRDRDRILWSQSLKSMANKTQLFPVETDDQLRRRLSHSIEVMQLAATIAYAFGLDRDLTEAGALVHDIGHGPFGHAGEHALDTILNEIDIKFGGFNHYENGLDVVRWIEAPYRSPGVGEFPGLNLTKETVECIIKHTFYRDDQKAGQRRLVLNSKHKDIKDDSCHLEGQAVRVADKVSYLISDLEDGIRVGAFGYSELLGCRFFERPPIDLIPASGESLWERFISQRRAILKVLMEDMLTSTDARIARLPSLQAVRHLRDYVVDFSPALKEELDEVWQRLQKGILHKHRAVVAENMQAARIVRDLLITYTIAPELIEPRFAILHQGLKQTDYMKWYLQQLSDQVGLSEEVLSRYAFRHIIGAKLHKQGSNWLVPTENLVLAKDYVASLTDSRAASEHRKHCSEVAQ